MTHRYEHMSSWKEKLPFYASELSDSRDLRVAEELGQTLLSLRKKNRKGKLSKLHDKYEDVMSRVS